MYSRGKDVLESACRVAISIEMYMSIITNTTPLANEARGHSN